MRTTADRQATARPGGRALRLARGRRVATTVLFYGVLGLLCAFVLLPLGWMLTVALKPDRVPVFTVPPAWFPTTDWRWENFGRTLTNDRRPFLTYMLNTL